MKIGTTGTQHGGTERQRLVFRELLLQLGVTELHHGDCIGWDAEAFAIATELGVPTVAHPPLNPKKRAFTKSTIIRPLFGYLVRNQHIVLETDYLIAAPMTMTEAKRSGTWATIRFSRTLHPPRPLKILKR